MTVNIILYNVHVLTDGIPGYSSQANDSSATVTPAALRSKRENPFVMILFPEP
jgi:hypothetical protein